MEFKEGDIVRIPIGTRRHEHLGNIVRTIVGKETNGSNYLCRNETFPGHAGSKRLLWGKAGPGPHNYRIYSTSLELVKSKQKLFEEKSKHFIKLI